MYPEDVVIMYPEEEIVIVYYPEENQTIAIENHGDIVILYIRRNTIVIIVKPK